MTYQGINPNAAAPDPPKDGPSLGDILAGLRARIGLILCVTAAVVALAVVVVTLLPTRYTSSSVVMLDPRKNTIADLSAVLSALPTDPSSIQNQIQILQSRDLAAEVIAKLGLYDDPEFNPALQQSVTGSPTATSSSPSIRRCRRTRSSTISSVTCGPSRSGSRPPSPSRSARATRRRRR